MSNKIWRFCHIFVASSDYMSPNILFNINHTMFCFLLVIKSLHHIILTDMTTPHWVCFDFEEQIEWLSQILAKKVGRHLWIYPEFI